MSDASREFAETAKKDWVRAAAKELNDDNPLAKLSHQSADLTILPYYDASDLPGHGQPTGITNGKPWVNSPKVIVDESEAANRIALSHLHAGADGILFEMRTFSPQPEILLAGIELEFCSIFFNGNVTREFIEKFALYAGKFNPSNIRGAVYGLSIHDFGHLSTQLAMLTQFRTIGLELRAFGLDANSLAQVFIEIQARLSQGKNSPTLEPAALLIDLSDDFFGEVIRLRAIDLLWTSFSAAYQQNAELFVHCHSKPFEDPALQPHGNMIAATSRAVSAIIGGANALTIDAETEQSVHTRIARNISFILHEEANLSRATNMSAGSYFVESAAHELAEKAWSLFKNGI